MSISLTISTTDRDRWSGTEEPVEKTFQLSASEAKRLISDMNRQLELNADKDRKTILSALIVWREVAKLAGRGNAFWKFIAEVEALLDGRETSLEWAAMVKAAKVTVGALNE